MDYKSLAGSMLSGGGMSDGKFWNFSREDQDNYMPVLEGTLTKVSFDQAKNYDANQRKFTSPAFWPDGNPKINIRLHITDLGGEVWLHEVQPKSACLNEDWLAKSPNGSLEGLLGQHIRVEAEQKIVMPDGRVIEFGSGNRRHFKVEVLGPGLAPSEGVDYESLERVSARAKQQRQPGAMPPGVPRGVMGQQQYQAAQYQQPQYQQPQYQPQPQPQYQPQPQAQHAQQVNSAMAAAYRAAQAAGYTAEQQQPVASAPQQYAPEQPPVDVYDEDLPF